jgi:5-(carboxyamino)imidazole ribonucleotide synthase
VSGPSSGPSGGETRSGRPDAISPNDVSERGRVATAGAFIRPDATLGVIGGGQLGRMFVQAAQRMGYRTVVLDPDRDSPAGLIAHRHVEAGYLDHEGLAELSTAADAVTTEFENVPAAALVELARMRRVAPSGAAVSICQDRAAEKAQFTRCEVACAPHAVLERHEQLASPQLDRLLPGILKTARLGYDGKGQVRVGNRAELADGWKRLGRAPCVLEQMLPLGGELSVIVARGFDGHSVVLPVQQNLHRDGILALTRVPAANVPADTAQIAVGAAQRLAASMDYVGVLCVEFFVLADGSLVANEMAPRPHNSGHYSVDACDVSQFELQVRTLVGAPLVTPRLHSPAVMLNLLGDLWWRDERAAVEPDWSAVLGLPGVHLHLYGKAEPRRGRKMGHLTVTGASAALAEQGARAAAAALGIEAW